MTRLAQGRAKEAGLLAACAAAAVAVGVLVGPAVLLHPGRAIVGANPSSEFQIMTWSLAWWPWALRHGVDPRGDRDLRRPDRRAERSGRRP